MCETRNSKRLRIDYTDRIIRIDTCMKNLIEIMRTHGIHTLACCCGHNKYPMTIVIRRYGMVEELISGINLNRTRNFYIKDDEGFYYIPETV